MCGINGIFAYNPSANSPDRRELIVTRDHMRARGPDGEGEWWSTDRRLALGHRRLSILDLSDRARQPMVSQCGRFVVTFNGEIYNYPQLKVELEAQGCAFRTTADTEVLLHLFAKYGAAMVDHLRGMFAFAIWDERERSLFLARDPYGIKPLYTANDGWTFRFASQVKALLAGGKTSRDPEPAGIVGFHLWGHVPEPFTLYREIRSLPAGHTQMVDAAGPREPQSYCSIAGILADGARQPANRAAVSARVRTALRDSVGAHMLADVEVGVFLSRGVDSGALLGLMRDAGQSKVRALTLSFGEYQDTANDEAPVAAEIARLYGAEHIVRRVDRAEFMSDLPLILAAMDQPTIDGVNSWFVAKAAREAGLKVALSGLGGDELFAGYDGFRYIPLSVRTLGLLAALPGAGTAWRALARTARLDRSRPKITGLLAYGGTYPGAYLLRRGLFLPFELEEVLDPDLVRVGLRRLQLTERLRQSMTPRACSALAKVAALESNNYMRNQLLRDSDWAGMAHSVEVRTPLVDVGLLRALAPIVPRLHGGAGKLAMASAPEKALPASVTGSGKLGFSVPLESWLAAPGIHSGSTRGAAARGWARELYRIYPASAPLRSRPPSEAEPLVAAAMADAPAA